MSAGPVRAAPFWASRPRRVIAGLLSLAWAGLVFWLSSRSDPLPFTPPPIPGFDKVLHLCAYAVLGALVAAALAGTRLGAGKRTVVIAAAVGSLYGVTDEYHQSFVPGRDVSAGDWSADTAGALGGAALAAAFLRRRGGAG